MTNKYKIQIEQEQNDIQNKYHTVGTKSIKKSLKEAKSITLIHKCMDKNTIVDPGFNCRKYVSEPFSEKLFSVIG